MQNFSLHTHTIGFDGQNTPHQMAERAKVMGMGALGISNHFIVHPDITRTQFYPFAKIGGYVEIYSSSFDEAIAKFKPHYQQLRELSDKCEIKLYRGLEVDFFDTPDWKRGFERAIKILRPDYVIGASHFIEYDGMLRNVHDIAHADKKSQRAMLELYWEKIGRAANSGLFNWMAHLDLPKKTGCGRDDSWVDSEQGAINKIAQSGTAMEINTGLYRPKCDEPYPSPRILKMAAAANIPVLLSDDAHRADQIGRHFDRAYDLARRCGITRFLDATAATNIRLR